jgi:hypothetical protein
MVFFALGAAATLSITPGLGKIAAGIYNNVFSTLSSVFYLGMVMGMGSILYLKHKYPSSAPIEIRLYPQSTPPVIQRQSGW